MTPTPKIGDRITLMAWSDRRAYTVVAVSSGGHRITLRRCKVALLNGLKSGQLDALTFAAGGFCGHVSGEQRWDIQDDPDGDLLTAHLRKDGRYYSNAGWISLDGGSEFYDYNF